MTPTTRTSSKATSRAPARGVTRALARRFWRSSPPSRFLDYKDFLRTLQRSVERQVGRYTYQQFAADLGFTSPSAVYVVLHGQRKLNREQVEHLTAALGIKGAERRYLLKLVAYTDSKDETLRQSHFEALVAEKERLVGSEDDRHALRFFREWYHAAIFELVGLPDFRADPDWIASRFYRRLTPDEAQSSLELLVSMKLVSKDPRTGRYRKETTTLSTGDEVRGIAVVGYHMEMLEAAKAAMSQTPADEREVGAVTIAVDEATARRLREDVRLLRRYAVFLSQQTAKPDRIVQLNLQLFPVTQPGG